MSAQLLEHQRALRPDRPAIREKDYGIWQTYSWGRVAAEVRDLTLEPPDLEDVIRRIYRGEADGSPGSIR